MISIEMGFSDQLIVRLKVPALELGLYPEGFPCPQIQR